MKMIFCGVKESLLDGEISFAMGDGTKKFFLECQSDKYEKAGIEEGKYYDVIKYDTPNGIYDVEETYFTEENMAEASKCGGPFYLLEDSVVDIRKFEDGKTRPVVRQLTAKIVPTIPENGTYLCMEDVPSFDELLETLLTVKKRVARSYYAIELESQA